MDSARNRNLTIGIIFALLFLGVGLDRLGYMTPVRALVQTIVQPAQGALSVAASQAGDVVRRQQNIEQLQEDNAFLQGEVNRLAVENIRLRELERENEQLRELLNYTRNNVDFDYTAASVVGHVIGSNPSNLLYTIFIDVGGKDGIAEDMPVITYRGLVGRVTRVSATGAQVLLIIDPASSVNVVTQNSRVQGIVRGELGGTLIMERIPQGETVAPGDLVLTSGLGGQFPDKLVIGQVTEVFQRDLDLFQTARVRSTVDFGELETVLVLTAFEPVDFEQEQLKSKEEAN
jgi:rod shape-determining protein MreC